MCARALVLTAAFYFYLFGVLLLLLLLVFGMCEFLIFIEHGNVFFSPNNSFVRTIFVRVPIRMSKEKSIDITCVFVYTIYYACVAVAAFG